MPLLGNLLTQCGSLSAAQWLPHPQQDALGGMVEAVPSWGWGNMMVLSLPAALASHLGFSLSFFSHCLSCHHPLGLSHPSVPPLHWPFGVACACGPTAMSLLPPTAMPWGLGPHPLSGHWKNPTVPWLFLTCWKHALPGPFPCYFMLTGSYFGFLLAPVSWVEGWSQVSLADLPSPSPLYSSTASLSPCFCCPCFCHPVCDGRLVFAGNPVWQHPPLQRVKEDPKYI